MGIHQETDFWQRAEVNFKYQYKHRKQYDESITKSSIDEDGEDRDNLRKLRGTM